MNFNDVFAHFYLGWIYKYEGNVEDAIKEYQTVIGLIPEYSWAYFNLASIYYEQGNHDLAKEFLNQTLEKNPRDIEAYKILSKMLCKNEKYKEAFDLLGFAIRENPENGDLYYFISQIFKLQNDLASYQKTLEKCLEFKETLSMSSEIIEKELQNLL